MNIDLVSCAAACALAAWPLLVAGWCVWNPPGPNDAENMATERARQIFRRGDLRLLTGTSKASREALSKSTTPSSTEEHVEEVFGADFPVETSPTELLCGET